MGAGDSHDENRRWLEEMHGRAHHTWPGILVEHWGLDQATVMLDIMDADWMLGHFIDLRLRPFAGDEEAKRLAREARAAVGALEYHLMERMREL